MAIFDRLINFIAPIDEESEEENAVRILDNLDSQNILVGNLWQYEYAFKVVANVLASFLINVDWKTYQEGKAVKKEEWYRFNYAMNDKETSSEFFSKLAHKLIEDGFALIIETSNRQFFIADSFAFKDGHELLMKNNTFINVCIGDIKLNRTFKENDSCMLIKAPQNDSVKSIMSAMASDYMELKALVKKGANKALGMKLNLNINAQPKNTYDENYMKKMQTMYKQQFENSDALFVTYKGETLTDLTEKQRGSEVQQVLDAVENNTAINNTILTSVGNAYGIPNKVMTGDYGVDNDDVYAMTITMFGKPYLQILQKKFTTYLSDKESIIKGYRIEANLDSIKFVEMLKSASAVDKLIGSGAYTINEVREKVGDDPTTDVDGDVRFITKNYAVLSEYVKGENNSEV